MKFFLLGLIILTASCSQQAKEAVYNMVHERERLECLKQGRSDCPRGESYDKYKQNREDVINSNN